MTEPASPSASERLPSVLVVLVVRNASTWLRGCLSALGAQRYPRLGVVGVDNGSTDGSLGLLRHALGELRVISLPDSGGLATSMRAAMEIPAARAADYLLVVHDDTALDPDAVARLVEAASRIGVEAVGVVGPKVVDWDEPRLLRDVGRSADRFGHPYTPLQPGEIDQGQFDRVVEVLCVPTCAMLISREAWLRTGSFDERLDARHEDLDFCWRARLAGFRVLMTPLARARHRAVSAVGEPENGRRPRSARYYEDRAAIAAMLKNYGLPSLLWILPLDLLLGAARLLFLVLGRRFEEAYDLVAAWGWNVVHLPGTISRRVRSQSVRRVSDRDLRRFMESAGLRIPRWFQTAEQILEEQREIEEEDEDASVGRRLRDRTASLVGSHPVVVGGFLAVVVGAIAIRGLLGPEALSGGALPAFPASWRAFFDELVSGYRTTPLGGTLAASPALAAMGGLSWLAFGSTALAQKLMLVGGPAFATIMTYRALARLTGRPAAAMMGAAAYGLSAIVMWAYSEGRIELLIGLSVLPPIAERLEVAFAGGELSDSTWRFVVGVGVTLAVGVAFLPGIALAVAALVVAQLVFGRSRARGFVIALGAAIVAAILLFSFVPTLVAGGGAALWSRIGTTEIGALARLALGGGPGSWVIAAFLPISAVLGLALVGPGRRGPAWRAAVASIAGLALAWLSAAGYLPRWGTNGEAYAALAAVGEATLVGLGLASVLEGLGREAFGVRQIQTAVLALVLGGGLVLQAAAAMIGGWAVGGPDAVPPAWAVVASNAKGDFNVLWLGADTGQPFVAPGGDPMGVAENGASSLRFSLTSREGISALDSGRAITGSGANYLRLAMDQILSGSTVHGGALLAPLGVRFLVASPGDLPGPASRRLDAQVDLDAVRTSGLVIYRNAAALPPAGLAPADRVVTRIVRSPDPAVIQALRAPAARQLGAVPGGWSGMATGPSLVVVSTEFNPDWRLVAGGRAIRPAEAFGWSTSFDVPVEQGQAVTVRVRFGAQWIRTLETIALAAIWAVALWITRRPVAR